MTSKSYAFHKSHHSYGNKQKWPIIQPKLPYNHRYRGRRHDECVDNNSDHPHIHQHSISSNNNFTDIISFKSPLSSSTTTHTNTPENNIDIIHSYNNSSSNSSGSPGSEYYMGRPVMDGAQVHDDAGLRRFSSPNNKISFVSKKSLIQSSVRFVNTYENIRLFL